jgi:CRP/FNR family transcriptional regulator
LFDRLLAGMQVVRLDRDRFVFHSGDLCQAFLVLLEGSVRVQLTSASGREVTLYRIAPGGSCILTTSCLLSHENYPAEAIAESDLVAAAIPYELFQRALEDSKRFRDRSMRASRASCWNSTTAAPTRSRTRTLP